MTSSDRGKHSWLYLLLLIWLAAAATLVLWKWKAIGGLALPDTDDNMRLQQVRDWIAGQGWYDLVQHRMDPPRGGEMHWSRLVDLPLAGIILALKPFVSAAVAERVAVALAPLLPLGVAMTAVAVIVRRTVAPSAWALGPAILLCASSALGMMTPLRIDHHGWQIALALVMVMGFVTSRALVGGAVAGLATALSMAIGIETLPYLAMGGATIILLWIVDAAERPRLLAYGAVLGLCAPLVLTLFLTPARWDVAMCDALSPAYIWAATLAGAGAVALALLSPARAIWRLAAAALLAGMLLLFEYRFYAGCLGDPYAGLSADLKRLWLSNVREARPIYRQDIEVAITFMALPVIGLVGSAWSLWRDRRDHRLLLRWGSLLLMTAFGTGLCLVQTRGAPLAQALAVPGAVALCWALVRPARTSRHMLVRALGTVAGFLIASGLVAQYGSTLIPKEKSASVSKTRKADVLCARETALAPLNRLPPATMLTMLDLGPRLIVRTHHSAIAGPYHRNGAAIVDLMNAWGGTPDEARAIIDRHGADYVLLCAGASETGLYLQRAKDGFYARLAKGRAPDWLTPVALPAGNPYRLWKVEK